MSVTLNSLSLWYKSGFDDGDILDDIVWDNEMGMLPEDVDYGDHHLKVKHEALARLVETRLLPAMQNPPDTMRIGSIHNPIRVRHDDHPREKVEVVIEDQDVVDLLRAIIAERAA